MPRFSTRHLLGFSAIFAVEAALIQWNPWSILWQAFIVFGLLSIASFSYAFYCVLHATLGLIEDSKREADKTPYPGHSRTTASKSRKRGDGPESAWQG